MTQDQIDLVFNRQLMLANQFGQIEENNTGLPFKRIPNDLTDYRGQFVIRFMLTCVLDEYWEASEARHGPDPIFLEELSDTFHYIVEVCLRASIWPMAQENPVINLNIHDQVGRIIHELKAKPWKVNPKPTDVFKVKRDIEELFWSFLNFTNNLGFSATQLTESYLAKAKINQQRIDSGA